MPHDPLATLKANLEGLARTSPDVARRVAEAAPAPDIEWRETQDGTPSAAHGPEGRLLASARRPLAEADRLADTIDLTQAGALVVLGFGVGHHVAALARRMARNGVVVVFEPDIALLRAVLERIDFSRAFAESNVVVLADPDDSAAMVRATSGVEGIFALGIKVVEHPPSRPRIGAGAQRFAERFTSVVRSLRTNVVTTLVQVEASLRNQLMNLDHYATAGGVGELAGIARDRPAVVVSAGPSLARNIDLLSTPGLRDRVVIVAVQTVLKPLLERGIRPHFVTALDYHEISRRFYEGLSPEEVEGVTLVAETKANPAILEAFPGMIRCPADPHLDKLLGDELRRPMGELTPGATVAHLACYLARHLGCDPVILVGQDLGFTDGQYYAAGAAIHRLWASELNPFRSLEMLEWERIVRSRRTLRKLEDVHGRPIYSDEQMNAYLVQFERDFAAAAQRGLRTIDATEGGVRKRGADPSTLADALAEHAALERPPVDWPSARRLDPGEHLACVRARLASVRADVKKIASKSRTTHNKLAQMAEHHRDQQRVNRLIDEVQAIGREVQRIRPAFDLVQHLNQTGTLKRVKADRGIRLDESLAPLDRQKRQIERDMMNVRWLADAADRLAEMLEDAGHALAGGPKQTRDAADASATAADEDQPTVEIDERAIAAVLFVDPGRSPVGIERDLSEPLLVGRNPLRMTLERLSRAARLERAVLVTHDRARTERIVGGPVEGLDIRYMEVDQPSMADRGPALRGGRRWALDCWRGGLGNLSIYDETHDPRLLDRAIREFGLHAAVLVGADWPLVDPAITDAVIERYLEGPRARRLTFAHAAPGLVPCLLSAELAGEMASTAEKAPVFASIGALLGYVPISPQHDPIASPACAPVAPVVRDLAFRCVADAAASRRRMREALDDLGEGVLEAPAERIAELLRESLAEPGPAPQHLVIDLTTADGGRAEPSLCARIVDDLRRGRNDAALTLAAAPGADPLDHPAWRELVCGAVAAGVPTHVRTRLACSRETAESLLDARPDAISVDMVARTAETYRSLTGRDDHGVVLSNLHRLLEGRGQADGGRIALPWVVPRITRCDAVYEEIEAFYDEWLLRAGSSVIDPLPAPRDGERIEPLPLPEVAAERFERTTLHVRTDGRIAGSEMSLGGVGLREAWSTLRSSPDWAPVSA